MERIILLSKCILVVWYCKLMATSEYRGYLMDFAGWLADNLLNILLVVATMFAGIAYFVQRHDRKKEAARLIVIQINKLTEGIKDIASRISNGQLNNTAFYESLPLMEENYWEKYKHIFVKNMTAQSINEMDEFFQYARVIQDQQQVIVNLEKNHFFVVQQSLCSLESQILLASLTNPQAPEKVDLVFDLLKSMGMPDCDPTRESEMKESLTTLLKGGDQTNDLHEIEGNFAAQKSLIEKAYNDVCFTDYIPVQTRISLEKTIRQCSLIEVKASAAFRKLSAIAKIG